MRTFKKLATTLIIALIVLKTISAMEHQQRTKRGLQGYGKRVMKVLRNFYDNLKKHLPRYTAVSHIYNPEPDDGKENAKCTVIRPKSRKIGMHRALTNEAFKWPRGIIPYELGNITDVVFRTFKRAAKDIMEQTCIQIVERKNEEDYVLLTDPGDEWSCYSRMGRWGGMQEIALGSQCGQRKGSVIHEVLHTLGFEHEHSRVDRDSFVRINWDNIEKDKFFQFYTFNGSYGTDETQTLSNDHYSYSSVMHYHEHGFSNNGQPTIEPVQDINRDSVKIGQRQGLDKSDIDRVREYYQCSRGRSMVKESSLGYQCKDSNKGYAMHKQLVKFNGYAYECLAKTNWKKSFLPKGCLNATGYMAINDEVFPDGSYTYRCVINSTTSEVSKTPKECIGDDGHAMALGQHVIYLKQMHVCSRNGPFMIKLKLAPAADLRCFPDMIPMAHGETVVNGEFVDQCVINSTTGEWQLSRVGCADEEQNFVKPGKNFRSKGKTMECYNGWTGGLSVREAAGGIFGVFRFK